MMDSGAYRSSGDVGESYAGRGGTESVIDRDSYFEGTYRTPGNMRVEGTYEGVIECQGTLVVAESARVNARIAAGSLTVAGQLEGEAQCGQRFEILRTGRVTGTVVARVTVVHEGAFFEGSLQMGDAPRPRAVAESSAAPARARENAQARPAQPSGGRPSRATPPSPVAPQLPSPAASESPASVDGESMAPDESGVDAAPRTNGRSQPGGPRDIMPNRTGE